MTVRDFIQQVLLNTELDNEIDFFVIDGLDTWYKRKVSARKGCWVKHDTGHSIYYDCSLCGCAAPCTETADKFLWKLSNYCPDCGSEMCNAGGWKDG